MQKRIVILGAGCGGLWLAYEFLERKIATLLIDTSPYAAYASTGNQGWLHSGALFAIGNDKKTAQACDEGFKLLKTFATKYAPDAVGHQSRGLFVFGNKLTRDKAADTLAHSRIKARVLERSQIEALEPNLRPADLVRYGLRTPDVPFDPHQILKALVGRLVSFGNRFDQHYADLREIDLSPQNGGWLIQAGGKRYTADVVICAAGVLNPILSNKFFRSQRKMPMHKSVVAVLRRRVCNNIVVVRRWESEILNLVPFADRVTVNFGRTDKEIHDPGDASHWPDAIPPMARQLTNYVPGLLALAGCEANFYVCQKLGNCDGAFCSHPAKDFGNRHYSWIREGKGVFFYNPGKFTIAPVGARALADEITSEIGTGSYRIPRTRKDQADPHIPEVAERPFFAAATHVTAVSDDSLIFKEQH